MEANAYWYGLGKCWEQSLSNLLLVKPYTGPLYSNYFSIEVQCMASVLLIHVQKSVIT